VSAIVSVGYQLVFLVFLAVFFCALVGFLVFYGLEKTVRSHAGRASGPSSGVYGLHLASFALFNLLLMFFVAEQAAQGPTVFTWIFAGTMGLPYLLIPTTLLGPAS